ncbi:hypothetical protein BDF19DRAFT_428341 [Syncephalis fuscata]|nr:hypothetical protein BDF19DRAFT_428341 [Syncephalis fuscata]
MVTRKVAITFLFLFVFLVSAGRDFFASVDAIPISLENDSIPEVTSEPASSLAEAMPDQHVGVQVHEAVPDQHANKQVHEAMPDQHVGEQVHETVPDQHANEQVPKAISNGLVDGQAPKEAKLPSTTAIDLDSPLLGSKDNKVKTAIAGTLTSMLPVPLQGVVAPEFVTSDIDGNRTESQIRKDSMMKQAVPFALATAAGYFANAAITTTITGATMGVGAIGGVALGGAAAGVIFDQVYTHANRAARRKASRKGTSDIGGLIDIGTGNKTLEEQQLDAEIAAEKNRTMTQKIKGMLPIVLGGAAGAVAGGLVGEMVGSVTHRLVSKPKIGHAMAQTAGTVLGTGSTLLAKNSVERGLDVVF